MRALYLTFFRKTRGPAILPSGRSLGASSAERQSGWARRKRGCWLPKQNAITFRASNGIVCLRSSSSTSRVKVSACPHFAHYKVVR